MVPLHKEPTAWSERQSHKQILTTASGAADGRPTPGGGRVASTEPSPREAPWARCGPCLISLTPHGHLVGRDRKGVYGDIEESLSEEGMSEPERCSSEQALAMQGGEGHSQWKVTAEIMGERGRLRAGSVWDGGETHEGRQGQEMRVEMTVAYL